MKKTLYIHIGLPKTGTTALQSTFRDCKDKLKEEKINFINFDSYAREIRLGKLPDSLDFFRNLDAKMKENEKAFLSSEFLTGMDSVSFALVPVKDIAQNLYETAGKYFDIKIILYLRRIDLWIESMYTQYVSDGGFLRFEEFIKEHNLKKFSYKSIIEPYEKVFGSENMILRIYDKKHLPEKNSLIRDFAEIIDSDVLRKVDLNTYSEKKANTGFNRTAVELAVLTMAQATRDEQKRIREILQYGSRKEPFHKNVFFPIEERRSYIAEREDYMNKIKTKYFKDIKGEMFSDIEEMDNSYQLTVEDASKVLTFAIMAPSKYEYIETLRTLQILYKIETALKKNRLSKFLMKTTLKIFGIKDKIS